MGRREPKTTTGVDIDYIHGQMREEMIDRAGPGQNQTVIDKEVYLIADVISALDKIDDDHCTAEVYETISACIEDLRNCL